MQNDTRQAVRAVVLAERRMVLLIEVALPWKDGNVWITPGGGIHPGESDHDALARELAEELGLTAAQIGQFLFERTFDLVTERYTRQHEAYYLVECSQFEPDPARMQADERGFLRRFAWWPLTEIATAARAEAGAALVAAVANAFNTAPLRA